LGAGDKAVGWRRFLRLNLLESQAAKGYRSDIPVLMSILQQFSAPVDGLNHPGFSATRDALAAHVRQLMEIQNVDIPLEIEISRNYFRPITPEQLTRLRDTAIDDVRLLVRFYKSYLPSRPRAQAYYELKPDRIIDALASLNFELTPPVTVQSIDAEINLLQQEIRDFKERIEEMNLQHQRIQELLEKIQNDGNPDDAAPPVPDDSLQKDGAQGIAIGQKNTSNSLQQPRVTVELSPADERPNRMQLQDLESRRATLVIQIDEREKRIQDLEKQKPDVVQKEQQREQRRIAQLRNLVELTSGLDRLSPTHNDPFFAAADDSVRRFIRAYQYATDANLFRDFQIQIQHVATLYPLIFDPNQRQAAAEMGRHLGWFENAMQVPRLVAAIRAQHSLPNVRFAISERLINQIARQPVNRRERVNEQILGRLIQGVANVQGDVGIDVLPDPNQVHAVMRLNASLQSDTYARTGRFTGYAGATGWIGAQRDLYAGVGGFLAEPVTGDVTINSFFKCVDSKSRLVQRIAWNEFCRKKTRSEQISATRTKNRVVPNFQIETDAALARASDQLETWIATRTENQRLLPEFFLCSTDWHILAIGDRTTLFDLGATVEPQAVPPASADVTLTLHESLASNYVSPQFAGRTFSNHELAVEFSKYAGADAPQADPDENWSIQFDSIRPVQFEFDGNRISVTVSGRRFSQNGRSIRHGLRIRVAMRIVRVDGQLRLVRDGRVTIDYINPERKDAQVVAFKNFLEERLNSVILTGAEPIVLPNNLIPTDSETLKNRPLLRQLHLTQMRTELGWLYAGWLYAPGGLASPMLVDTPAIWPAGEFDFAPPLPAENR
jgi:TolA-binding protein